MYHCVTCDFAEVYDRHKTCIFRYLLGVANQAFVWLIIFVTFDVLFFIILVNHLCTVHIHFVHITSFHTFLAWHDTGIVRPGRRDSTYVRHVHNTFCLFSYVNNQKNIFRDIKARIDATLTRMRVRKHSAKSSILNIKSKSYTVLLHFMLLWYLPTRLLTFLQNWLYLNLLNRPLVYVCCWNFLDLYTPSFATLLTSCNTWSHRTMSLGCTHLARKSRISNWRELSRRISRKINIVDCVNSKLHTYLRFDDSAWDTTWK